MANPFGLIVTRIDIEIQSLFTELQLNRDFYTSETEYEENKLDCQISHIL